MFGKIKSLRELFEVELGYAYDCEQKLVSKGLPSMIEAAGSPQLRNALEHHLGETRGQLSRLERIFSAIGAEPKARSNEVLDELMKAAKDSHAHIEDSPLRDTALITNGNQVEHYEIALYGSLVSFARQLGLREAVSSLEQTLTEEKAADAKLTQLAESSANVKAAQQHAD
jgi:ferritin-like metal-binding protein YciE